MKKVALCFFSLVLIINFSFISSASAFSVVGSNALKQVVIGSWESAGIKFGSKAAKDKAYDAWSMKAYDAWLKDEKNGRNAELWAEINRIQQTGLSKAPTGATTSAGIDIGKTLISLNLYGFAVMTGAEIGYAIQERQNDANYMDIIAVDLSKYADLSFNKSLGATLNISNSSGYPYGTIVDLMVGDHIIFANQAGPNNDPNAFAWISGSPYLDKNKEYFNIPLKYTYTDGNGTFVLKEKITSERVTSLPSDFMSPKSHGGTEVGVRPKELIPPRIEPAPNLIPVVNPLPSPEAWGDLSKDFPQEIPIHVPMDDTLWDGEINPEFDPGVDPEPTPGTDPGKEPGTDPGKEPGTDPGKEPEDKGPDKDKEKEDLQNESESLGNLVTTRFPFSLPWDFMALLKLLYAEPKTPKWEVTGTEDIPLNFTIDLKFLDPYAPWFRGFVLIGFIFSVIFMHSRFMGGSK